MLARFKNISVLLLLILSSINLSGQSKLLGPFPSFEYTHQKINYFSFSLGVWNHKNFYAGGGTQFYKNNNALYVAPNLQIERAFLISKSYKYVYTGPLIRLNLSSHKINGQRDNYLTADIGLRILWWSIFIGYNYSLDKKDLNQISPLRVGIKCW